MTKQEQVKQLFKKGHPFNISRIEYMAGIRRLKVYEFLKGKRDLNNDECLTILNIAKNAIKLQK